MKVKVEDHQPHVCIGDCQFQPIVRENGVRVSTIVRLQVLKKIFQVGRHNLIDEKDKEREGNDHANEEAQDSQRADSRRFRKGNLVGQRRTKPKVVHIPQRNVPAKGLQNSVSIFAHGSC